MNFFCFIDVFRIFVKRFLLDLSIGKLYLVSFTLLLGIVTGWWYFLYSPLLIGNEQNTSEIVLLHAQLERCKVFEHQYKALQDTYITAKNTCNRLIEQAQMHDPQKAIQAILTCAYKSNVSLLSYEMHQAKDAEKLVANYEMQGPYENIVSFLSDLEKGAILANMISCKLTQVSESEIRCMLKYECSKMDLIV